MEIRWYMLLAVVAIGLALVGLSGVWSDAPSPVVSDSSSGIEQPVQTPAEVPVEPADQTATTPETGASTEQPEPLEIVATINQLPITGEAFEQAKGAILNQYAQGYAQFGMSIDSLLVGAEGRMMELSIEAEAMYRVFGSTLIEAEAEARGLLPTDDEIQTKLDFEIAQILEAQGWTEEDLSTYLAGVGSSYVEFLEDGWQAVSWELKLEAVVDSVVGEINPTDDELQTYFDAHQADYATEEQVKLTHILFSTTELDLREYLAAHEEEFQVDGVTPPFGEIQDQLTAAVRAEAEAALVEINAGTSLDEIATRREMSPEDQDLGWMSRGLLGEAFDTAAFGLEIGEISEVVETSFGFFILRLDDRRDAYTPELAEVLDEVRPVVEEQLRTERMQAWMETTYAAAEVEISLPLVDAIWTQDSDLQNTLAKLELLVQEGLPEEPYLGFILASMYELKLEDVISEKAVLESDAAQTDELTAQIAALDLQIALLIAKAAEAYRLSLDIVGEDAVIQSRLDGLDQLMQSADPEVDTDE